MCSSKEKLNIYQFSVKLMNFNFISASAGSQWRRLGASLAPVGPRLTSSSQGFFLSSIFIIIKINDPHLIRESGQPETSAPSGGSSSAASQQGQGNSIINDDSSYRHQQQLHHHDIPCISSHIALQAIVEKDVDCPLLKDLNPLQSTTTWSVSTNIKILKLTRITR